MQDLYEYHKVLLTSAAGNLKAGFTPPFLSEATQKFFGHLLLSSPASGYSLLQHLTSSSNTLLTNNRTLEAIHLSCLMKAVTHITNGVSIDGDSEINRTIIYQLLALFDPKHLPEGDIKDLMRELVICLAKERSRLDWGIVYSSLLGHETSHLVDMFVAVQYKLSFQAHVDCSLQSAGLVDDVMEEPSQYLLSLSKMSDRETAWRDLYLLCHREQRHFLDLTMVTAQTFNCMCIFPNIV